MKNEIKTISQLIESTEKEMVHLDYKPSVLKQFNVVWNKLRNYAGAEDVGVFNVKFGMDFLEGEFHIFSKPLTEATSNRWMKAIFLLSDFKRTGVITLRHPRKEYIFADEFKEPFNQYISHQKAIGLSENHIRDTTIYLERFSRYLFSQNLKNISGLNIEIMHGFVNSLAVYELPTIYHTLCTLRTIFRFLYEKKYILIDLVPCVPNVKYNKRTKIPSAYSKEEVERILLSIDRGNARGKRDYAIIILAARLGIRASDIAGLTFDSVRWEKNTIEFVQQKTGQPLVLPLLNDVGEAVIDYIKYARPISEEKNIFLKLNAPCDIIFPNSIHHIVYTRMKEAGIKFPQGKKHGPHALRHSLASALLEDNIPMPVISEVLGHNDTESTSTYLRIDINKLKSCALPVPNFLKFLEKDGEY